MNKKIFRAVALERLSSPEQLDQLLRVTRPRHWLALLAILLMLGAAGWWSVRGTVRTTVAGEGIIVRTGGVLNIVAPGTGVVSSLKVKVGDRIERGQVVATIAQPSLLERIRMAHQTLAEARLEKKRAVGVRSDASQLQIESIRRQQANAEREIKELREQVRLASEQVPVEEQLLAKGLITRQQVIATQQKIVALNAQIQDKQALLKQLAAQLFATETQPGELAAELDARIASLERSAAALRKELALASEVISPYEGEVLEVQVHPGTMLAIGTPLLSIQSTSDKLEVLMYLPADKAKDAAAGMEVQISPSTVKREEYGYLKGRIVFVADYPATRAALMRNFENESLVDQLTRLGPVNEVRVEIETDPASVSGFRWSSPAGPPVTLSSGTLCVGTVVTREQAPITLLFPSVKGSLGLS
ncbi:MAG: NHLP bacteriocin system secretion protein [Acidimicrobiia bacterium]|nr:NHLP bacteriocin system secretion protein [Acidimicrobiia bacterium]